MPEYLENVHKHTDEEYDEEVEDGIAEVPKVFLAQLGLQQLCGRVDGPYDGHLGELVDQRYRGDQLGVFVVQDSVQPHLEIL